MTNENNHYDRCNHKAALRRFKQVIKVLSDCIITAGWSDSFRKEEANRFQRYLERRAAGGGEHAKTERDLWDWLYIHGQNCDYVLRGDVTGMICHGAHHSAVADVIRERRRGVSDRWSVLARGEADCDKRRLQSARHFMGPLRKHSRRGRGEKAERAA
jgi:hypothetical protein